MGRKQRVYVWESNLHTGPRSSRGSAVCCCDIRTQACAWALNLISVELLLQLSSCLPILEILDGKGPEGQDPTEGEATSS